MSEERLIEIETRLVYQERMLRELSDVVWEQQKRLDRLEELVKFLGARLDELAQTLSASATKNEKPPHY